MAEQLVDGRFYQVARPGSLAERMAVAAREAMYADFVRLARPLPEHRILDVGVSDVINEAANMLERRHPFPGRITAAGLGDPAAFRAAYPAIAYDRIVAGEALPYPDRSFDIAVSNAVLEHVGSPRAQTFFVDELLRVSRAVFLTVPNRLFPLEHHTGLPFLHWTDLTFAAACRAAGKHEWAQRDNLILMTSARLARLFAGRNAQIGYTGLRLGPFSSNLYACSRSD